MTETRKENYKISPGDPISRIMARGKGRKELIKEIMPDNFPMKYMKDSLSTSIMTIKRPN